MSYASYDFYASEYAGTLIDSADFDRLALRASSYIDYITMGRAAKSDATRALQMACCAIAEEYQQVESAQQLAQRSLTFTYEGAETQSQTVGNWTRTFRSGGESALSASSAMQDAKANLYNLAVQYLAPTGLLYRGRGRQCFRTL